jgi:hypothetical protein
VVFHGSSGGGFPSLYFSSYFHKKALIQQAQIYLNNYYNIFDSFLKELNLQISDFNEINGEQVLSNLGLPKHLVFYCNSNDKHHYEKHFLPFLNYVSKNNWNTNFTFIEFIGDNPIPPQTHHIIQVPKNVNIIDSIKSLFDS